MYRPMTRKSFLARGGMLATGAGLLAEESWARSRGWPGRYRGQHSGGGEGTADSTDRLGRGFGERLVGEGKRRRECIG